MDTSDVICREDRRRDALRADGHFNGIDYVEVQDVPSENDSQHGATLHVYLLSRLPDDPSAWLDVKNVKITRVDTVDTEDLPAVSEVSFREERDEERDDWIIVTLTGGVGRATYRLSLQATDEHPLSDLDPRYASAEFSLAVDAWPTEMDCLTPSSCPPQPSRVPDLDYLAKDYASFRQLLLDRLAITLPGWRDRQSPDLYLTLLEVLAYHADHLSYAQDAVATEAYLGTARLRTSVRRHARLVDYRMHEGCNARTWVTVEVEGNPTVRADQVQFLTRPGGLPDAATVLLEDDVRESPRDSYEVFQPLPEQGWEEIVERDILHPQAMADRILDEDAPGPRAVRDALPQWRREAVAAAAENGRTEDLRQALRNLLGRLLDDAALAEDDSSIATPHQGTTHALHGVALRRHNRCKLQEIFPEELVEPARYRFHQAHNRIRFHTWHQADCCLPKGATRATLRDDWLDDNHDHRALDHLAVNDVLILEEVVNPRTGKSADVDPAHRHPVRLTKLVREVDPLGDIPVVEVEWAAEDALPFSLAISAIGPPPECTLLEDVSVARGNVVLVDHGETERQHAQPRLHDGARTYLAVPFDPPDDIVPTGDIQWCCAGEHLLQERAVRAGRYTPRLARRPLVFAAALPKAMPAARDTLKQDPRAARPQVALFSPIDRKRPWTDALTRELDDGGTALYERWLPRFDLLNSDSNDRHFVVEIDDRGIAHIRFGDGELGARPIPDARYLAWYRVGGGPAGNVGRDVIRTLLLRGTIDGGTILGVRNPLPARGGTAPESVDEVRLRAPHAFRTTLRRAVTLDDYAAIALRDFPDRIQRAAARFVDGSGDESNRSQVHLYVDPVGASADDEDLRVEVEEHMRPFIRIGHELTVPAAAYVPIDLTLEIRLAPHHQWGAVVRALRDRFSNRIRPDGGYGFFHPDRITFGQPIAVSAIVAAALGIPGVSGAKVTRLSRHAPNGSSPDLPDSGVLVVQPAEIVRLDNDPNWTENGELGIEKEAAQ